MDENILTVFFYIIDGVDWIRITIQRFNIVLKFIEMNIVFYWLHRVLQQFIPHLKIAL